MHPLSIFPQLFNYEIFAPLLLRLIVSLFLLWLGLSRYKKEYKGFSVLYFLSSILIFLGLYTQPASILGMAILKFDFYIDYWKNRNLVPVQTERYFLYFIAVVILISLLLTGPGAFAFDLPL
ncbi:MAG: hypothetical protein CEO12_507 [Parcubacteria group bacterium Gr01-1014_46]|nr:MAG: hypothetical protein CEO12_507 [Parcubacteria group bacterium Gr01-1014_46]